MTKQELSDHVELRKRLAASLELLASLEAAAGPGAQKLDGLPRAPGIRDRVGDCASAIADAKEDIARTEAKIARSESAVVAFISTIGDLQTRTIFRLRFLGGMSWKEVATATGGGNTESGVKNICYRYIARGGPARMGRPPKQKGGE